ncbi:MAG: hypothetical protein JXA46_11525 [Dehalococcoidales bacterium]|nr:hypothetical protein [Dehalococcoidales bacterium]
MKKMLIGLSMAAILVIALAVPAFAGGDQVRGDKADGPANQVQIQDPPPFQP